MRLIGCLCLIALCAIGCSSATSTPAEPAGNTVAGNLSGLWNLTTSTGGLIGMAGLTRSIKLVIRQAGDKVTGAYRCSPGNALCRNGNEKGSIQGTASGNQVNLNIMLLPDASNCRYMGTLVYNGNGQYTCYLQGQIVEQGNWEVSK